jgi:AraC-like DNA-binding protein
MLASRLRHQQFEFHAWRAQPQVMSGAHVHTDVELNLFLQGEARYFLAGRFHDVAAGRLAVFWAGMPHRLEAVQPGTEYLCMTLPLGWFLGWGIGGPLRDRLLSGDLIQDDPDDGGTLDASLFGGWARDLADGGAEARRIVLLELEARLRRLALRCSAGPSPQPPPFRGEGGPTAERFLVKCVAPIGNAADTGSPAPRSGGGWGEGPQVERMAAFLGRRYQDLLTVADVAEAVGLHPNYAMAVFKQGCGLSIGEYLTRLRVSHAQRLLLTTDWTVDRIALDCGFGSPSRFFAAFKSRCGCTPRAYRLRG